MRDLRAGTEVYWYQPGVCIERGVIGHSTASLYGVRHSPAPDGSTLLDVVPHAAASTDPGEVLAYALAQNAAERRGLEMWADDHAYEIGPGDEIIPPVQVEVP